MTRMRPVPPMLAAATDDSPARRRARPAIRRALFIVNDDAALAAAVAVITAMFGAADVAGVESAARALCAAVDQKAAWRPPIESGRKW